jgi:hypothetical protein
VYIGSDYDGGKVMVISETNMITTPVLPQPGTIQIDPVTDRAYIADASGIAVISGGTIVANIADGFRPEQVRAAPPTQYAYLGSSSAAGGVVPILGEKILSQTTFNRLAAPIDFDSDSAAGLVYVPDYYSQTISMVYGTEVIGTIPVSNSPTLVRFNPSTDYGYALVTSGYNYQLAVLQYHQVITTIPIPMGYVYSFYPSGLVINPQTDIPI